MLAFAMIPRGITSRASPCLRGMKPFPSFGSDRRVEDYLSATRSDEARPKILALLLHIGWPTDLLSCSHQQMIGHDEKHGFKLNRAEPDMMIHFLVFFPLIQSCARGVETGIPWAWSCQVQAYKAAPENVRCCLHPG